MFEDLAPKESRNKVVTEVFNTVEASAELNSDNFIMPRSWGIGRVEYSKEVVTDDGGTKRFTNITSPNVIKLSDHLFSVLQETVKNRGISYFDIKDETESELRPLFIEKNICDENGHPTSRDNKKRMRLAIDKKIREKISDLKLNILEVDFEEFIHNVKIPGYIKNGKIRFKESVNGMLDAQQACRMFWTEEHISGDLSEISTEIVSSMLVPTIRFRLGGDFKDIRDLVDSKAKNKTNLIKKIIFEFSTNIYAGMFSLGGGFILPDRKMRTNFTSLYSFKLDLLIRAIKGVQNWDNINYFPFDEKEENSIQKIFGVNYKLYGQFKKSVLDKAIQEIKKFTEFNVEIKEHKKGKKVIAVSFIVTPKIGDEFEDITIEHYIASQHWFFSEKSEALNGSYSSYEEYLAWVKEAIKTAYQGKIAEWDKQLSEWKNEWAKEETALAELLKYWVLKSGENEIIQESFEIDPQKICLVKKGGETIKIYGSFEITKPSISLEHLKGLIYG